MARRRLRITILDLIPQGPATSNWARVMNANMASIMPPVIAAWCERAGHEVRFHAYTGFEDLPRFLDTQQDLVFVSSFTRSAQLAYAVSALCRSHGAVTVLGGPHARCYPEDAALYFDYVLGFTDEHLLEEVLADPSPHRPIGRQLTASRQPAALPALAERWKFIAPTLEKAPLIKLVPLVGALGCPYTCSFCIDADVAYQPLGFEQMREDLRFVRTKMARPRVGWHDPNFGVRFEDTMEAIEASGTVGAIDHVAECSLSILSGPRLERLKKNGFKGILPGIESWYEMGEKSKTGRATGEDKVRSVVEQVNTILRFVPYVQVNFVLGLDSDAGAEPFELTKRFLDRCPGAFPAYSLMTAFGEAAPANLALQSAGRVLPSPFHFLDNNKAMNVRPLHYAWPDFYDHVIDLLEHSFTWRSIARRFACQGPTISGLMNLIRATSSEGFGRIRYHKSVRARLEEDVPFRRFVEGETTEMPEFYRGHVRTKLGPFWEHLPDKDLGHDPCAYLKKTEARTPGLPVARVVAPGARPRDVRPPPEIGADALPLA